MIVDSGLGDLRRPAPPTLAPAGDDVVVETLALAAPVATPVKLSWTPGGVAALVAAERDAADGVTVEDTMGLFGKLPRAVRERFLAHLRPKWLGAVACASRTLELHSRSLTPPESLGALADFALVYAKDLSEKDLGRLGKLSALVRGAGPGLGDFKRGDVRGVKPFAVAPTSHSHKDAAHAAGCRAALAHLRGKGLKAFPAPVTAEAGAHLVIVGADDEVDELVYVVSRDLLDFGDEHTLVESRVKMALSDAASKINHSAADRVLLVDVGEGLVVLDLKPVASATSTCTRRCAACTGGPLARCLAKGHEPRVKTTTFTPGRNHSFVQRFLGHDTAEAAIAVGAGVEVYSSLSTSAEEPSRRPPRNRHDARRGIITMPAEESTHNTQAGVLRVLHIDKYPVPAAPTLSRPPTGYPPMNRDTGQPMVWNRTCAHDVNITKRTSGVHKGILHGWIPDPTKTALATRECPGCGNQCTIADYAKTKTTEDQGKSYSRWAQKAQKCSACTGR